ncbi:MAG: hypothetical protein NTV36_00525 [Candidatus Staskawiczbacteria bacterium]|nr:hypothetical protein [Candidatus Staskawiczbacteria bacterium]
MQKNTKMAILAYVAFFIPFFTKEKDDPFVKYHVKQSLVLFILSMIVSIFVSIVPVFELIIGPILDIFLLVLFFIGIANAYKGLEKPLPIIGDFADNFKF